MVSGFFGKPDLLYKKNRILIQSFFPKIIYHIIALWTNYIINFLKVNSINVLRSTMNVEVMKRFFMTAGINMNIKYLNTIYYVKKIYVYMRKL